jgi:hypothetical protein
MERPFLKEGVLDKVVGEFSRSLHESTRVSYGYKHKPYINIYKRLFTLATVNKHSPGHHEG